MPRQVRRAFATSALVSCVRRRASAARPTARLPARLPARIRVGAEQAEAPEPSFGDVVDRASAPGVRHPGVVARAPHLDERLRLARPLRLENAPPRPIPPLPACALPAAPPA